MHISHHLYLSLAGPNRSCVLHFFLALAGNFLLGKSFHLPSRTQDQSLPGFDWVNQSLALFSSIPSLLGSKVSGRRHFRIALVGPSPSLPCLSCCWKFSAGIRVLDYVAGDKKATSRFPLADTDIVGDCLSVAQQDVSVDWRARLVF